MKQLLFLNLLRHRQPNIPADLDKYICYNKYVNMFFRV